MVRTGICCDEWSQTQDVFLFILDIEQKSCFVRRTYS